MEEKNGGEVMASGIELATAYVQIVPSAEGIEGKITEALEKEAGSAGDKAGQKSSKSFGASLAKGIAAGSAVVAAAGASMVNPSPAVPQRYRNMVIISTRCRRRSGSQRNRTRNGTMSCREPVLPWTI